MVPNKFIVSGQNNPGFSGAISLYCCQFSVTEYTDKLFQQHRIYFPADIETTVRKRRAEFFAGRYCAKKSLLSLNNAAPDIHIGQHRNPLWPAHIVGSISHSNNHAVAVTALESTNRGIGIDIQNEIDRNTYVKIKSQVIFRDEYNAIFQRNQGLNQQQLLTVVFSVKESFFKAAFAEVGRYFDFSSVSIMHINQKAQLILMRINETLSEKLTKGFEIQAEYRILPDRKIMTLVRLDWTQV